MLFRSFIYEVQRGFGDTTYIIFKIMESPSLSWGKLSCDLNIGLESVMAFLAFRKHQLSNGLLILKRDLKEKDLDELIRSVRKMERILIVFTNHSIKISRNVGNCMNCEGEYRNKLNRDL